MLSALLWGLAALLGLVLVALALPIRIAVEAHTTPERRLRLKMALFGGALPLPAVTAGPAAASPERPAPTRRRARRRRGGRRPALRIVAIPVRKVASDLRSGLRLRRLKVDGRVGLGDPADTGRLWGWTAPLLYGLPMPGSAEIALAPAFGGPALEGTLEAEGEVRLVPLARLGLRVLWALYGPRRGGDAAWA